MVSEDKYPPFSRPGETEAFAAADAHFGLSKAAEPPVVGDGGAIRVLCKAFNMHESFADTDDEPKLRDYLRNMAGLSDYQIDTTLLAMSSKAGREPCIERGDDTCWHDGKCASLTMESGDG